MCLDNSSKKQLKMSVKDRIKTFIDYNNQSISLFEKSINASNGYINSISKSIGLDKLLLIIEKYPNLNVEWLLTGKGEMIKPKNSTKESKQDLSSIPIIKMDNKLDTYVELLKSDNTDDNFSIEGYVSVPNIQNCDGATYAIGESMYPLLKSGDLITFKIISPENIFFGEMYLLSIRLDDKVNYNTIKFIHKSDLGIDHIKLVSKNPLYDPQDISISKITFIALVRGSIRSHN